MYILSGMKWTFPAAVAHGGGLDVIGNAWRKDS